MIVPRSAVKHFCVFRKRRTRGMFSIVFFFLIEPCLLSLSNKLKTARSRNGPVEPVLAPHLLFHLHLLNLLTSTFPSFSRLFIWPYAAVQLRTGAICPQCVPNYTPLQIKLVRNAVSAGMCTCTQLWGSSTYRIRFLLKLISAENSSIFRLNTKALLNLINHYTDSIFLSVFLSVFYFCLSVWLSFLLSFFFLFICLSFSAII